MNIKTRYNINLRKVANSLISPHIKDRSRILFTQGLLYPLQSVADKIRMWAIETHIECAMTSQTFYFEWFLNRKFDKYFVNKDDRISILTTSTTGTAIYHIGETDDDNFVVANEDESIDISALYHPYDKEDELQYSFIVNVPKNNDNISDFDYLRQLNYWISRYKIAGKTYKIIINGKDI